MRKAGLNPFGLDWRRFTVVTYKVDTLIGCVQWKEHGDGSRELASLVVIQEWRRKGVARALIAYLLTTQPPPLWLMCAAELVPFYQQFGFEEIVNPAEMPPYFRRIRRLVEFVRRIVRRDRFLAIMVHQLSSSDRPDG